MVELEHKNDDDARQFFVSITWSCSYSGLELKSRSLYDSMLDQVYSVVKGGEFPD